MLKVPTSVGRPDQRAASGNLAMMRDDESPTSRWLPGLRLIRSYRRSWIRHDVYAGLAVTAVLIPAGMGYAVAAGLPPVNGLYATAVPLLVYAVVGPSRILIFGPDSSLAPLIAATVLPLAGTDTARATSLAAALAVLVGVMSIAAGLARFGFLTDLLSIPVRYGYLSGIALVIVLSQLAVMCGVSLTGDNLFEDVGSFVSAIRDGKLNQTSLALGLGALVAIVGLRRYAPKVPAALLAVVTGIAIVTAFDLDGIALVGELPSGWPSFELPDVNGEEIAPLLAGAAGIAVVAMTDTSILSRSLALRGPSTVDANQELVAAGSVNAVSGLFQGFPVSASASRTPVAAASGAKSQLTGVVGAVAVLVVLAWFPGLFRNLPSAVLAAVVISAALSLIQVRALLRLARIRPGELAVSLVALAGIAVFGVIAGIGIAVAVSLLAFVRRAWAPHIAELVRVDDMKGYHDVVRHPEGRRIPGIVLVRFDAPLFFANAEAFQRTILTLTDRRKGVRWIVVTAEPITDIDTTGAQALSDVLDLLEERGIVLAFAELKGHVRDRLALTGIVDRIGTERFYPTIGEAVRAAVNATGADWTDWEERAGG